MTLALLASVVGALAAAPVGTTFTYQGRLNSAGQPASGSYDLKFTLYDAAVGSGQVGSPVTVPAVIITNGSFTLPLDFGAMFNGDARWLEIGVRTNGTSSYATLSPRQLLTPSPYALFAPSAGAAALAATSGTATNLLGNLNGDVTGSQLATAVAQVGGQKATDVASASVTANAATSTNMPGRIVKRDAVGNFYAGTITAASFTGDAAGLTGLNASQLASGAVPSARLSGLYTGALTFNNASNSFSGSGAGLTNLNAGALASGTVPSAQFSGTYANPVTFNNGSNNFTGNGAGLTNLNAGALASGAVPGPRLSGTYSSAVTFNNTANAFSGDGAGLTSAGLARTTVLNVNCSGSGVSYSTAYTKVADIGAFTKLLPNSTIEVTFNGRTYVSGISFGSPGAIFELRVDNAATSNGRARASYRYSEASNTAGVQTSIAGIFTGLGVGNHTVSMWVQAAGAGASGAGAQLDPGCWGTDHVVVKELK